VFSVDALEAVHPVARERLEIVNDVQILADVDLTPLDSPAPNLAYIFKHVITQEVAYGLMLYAQRRELHRSTAEWYERGHEESSALNYPLLAHHWANAGEDPQAIDYLERAAQAALRSHANDEVVRFLSDAIERSARVPIEPARRAHWDVMLGQAKRALGNYPAAGEHLEAALRALGVAIPETTAGLVRATLGQLARQVWHRMRRPVHADRQRAERMVQVAHALDQLFMIYFFGGEEIRMLYAGLAALNFAEDVGEPTPVLARAYGTLQTIAASIPLHGQMRYFIAKADSASEAVDSMSAMSWVLLTKATAIAGLGSWTDAEVTLEETAKLTERLGDDRTWCEATASLGTTTGARGAFHQSMAHYENVLAHGARRRDLQAQGWGIVGQARCYFALGELDTLDRVLEQAADILGRGGVNIDFLTRFDDQALRALRALAAGDDAGARTVLEATVHSLTTERVPTQWMYMQAYGYFADAATELWSRHPERTDDARLARFAEKRLAGYARIFPCGRPRLTLTRSRHARIRGRESEAARLLERALSESRALAMEYEQKLCAEALAAKPPPQ
jgi:tetratricopeptide (TPR) repeat protein